MKDLNFQYPPIYFLLCILLGLAFAIALYYRDKKFLESKKWLPYLLGLFRFLVVSLLSMLLLVPMLKSIFEEVKNPIIVFANDMSSSMTVDNNSSENLNVEINKLKTSLADKFKVDEYYFSNDLYTTQPDSVDTKSTNLEKVFKSIDELYINQNVGAVVLTSDGIFNEGMNPLYINSNISAPLYTIAVGDTSKRKDLVLRRALNNKIVFLGDKFAVQLDINAQNCAGVNTNLTIRQMNEDGTSKQIKSIPISIDKNDFFTTQEVILDADQSGVVRYIASLNATSGEISRQNNRKDIFVEILDARQKILMLANAPHPDVAAFKKIIESNKNYEFTFSFMDDNDPLNENYDLLILHNLPSGNGNLANILSRPNLKNTARMFVLGSQTNQNLFNQIQSVVSLKGNSKSLNDVQAVVDNNFKLFSVSESIKSEISNYPPLKSPFGTYTASPNSTVLLKQKIGKVDTDYPLLAFSDQGGVKTGVISAEGLWKWRLFNFIQKNHFEEVSELVNKSLQYLTLKEDKRKFRAVPAQNIFKENEAIVITSELYNDSYEKINEPDVNIRITDSEKRNFNFVFSKYNDYYYLDAGKFPAGNYKFSASTEYNGKKLEQSGRFSVESIQLEAYDLTARHGLLKSLADKYGGQLIAQEEVASLQEIIESNNKIKPVIYASSRTNKLMDRKWIFFLIFSMLGLEWFLRRYFGSY